MKQKSLFVSYLLLFAALTVAGYLLDPILGVWRQGCVGVLLLAVGILLRSRVDKQNNHARLGGRFSPSATLLLAGGILMAFSLRLLMAVLLGKMGYSAPLVYPNAGFGMRILATVILPTLCAPVLGLYIFPALCPRKGALPTIGCCMIAYIAFGSSPVHLLSAVALGGVIGYMQTLSAGNCMVYTFVSYFMLMFYDTFAISLEAMDLNLDVTRAISFFLFALALTALLGYFSLLLAKKRKFHIGEMLTLLFVVVIIILIAVAL